MDAQIDSLMKQKRNKSDSTSEYYAKEWLKCKLNPLYFILNYVYIPEGPNPLKITEENLHPKVKRVVRSVYHYHKAVFMASRQLGKSVTAAELISWATVFYPGIETVILNMKQNAALHNLKLIRFIINNLPSWMVTNNPFKQKGEIKTYLRLFNDSHIQVFYPSTVHNASTLARSLTVPILYIDEAAFIRQMSEIYGSAQQTLSRAREQAIKHNYPYFILVTSTPNGTAGEGEWFYNRWQNAVDSDHIFTLNEKGDDETWRTDVDTDTIVNDSSKNTFIRVQYHWSEDPTKDNEWYRQQCQELDNQRQVNQELDLVFVGTSNCLFSDELLSSFKAQNHVQTINCPHSSILYLYEQNLDPTDYYLIGCDTAESLEGAYCAVEIFSFREFNQIGELQARFGSYTSFGQVIDFIFREVLYKITDKLLLCIENNTIGKAPIEYLRYQVQDFVYEPFFYKDDLEKDDVGIKTTGLNKPHMAGCLLEHLNDNPTGVKSRDLINQFSSIEQTNSGKIRSTGYSDLFMASGFCAYARSKRAVQLMPKVGMSRQEEESQLFNNVKSLINICHGKQPKSQPNEKVITTEEDFANNDPQPIQFGSFTEEESSSFFPIFDA